MGLRGAVEPELVMEVELSSWSWYPRRLRMEACLGREDLLSGLRDPPSCWCAHTNTHTQETKISLGQCGCDLFLLEGLHVQYYKMKAIFITNHVYVFMFFPELLQLQCCSAIHLPWLRVSVILWSLEALLRMGEVYLMRQSLWI